MRIEDRRRLVAQLSAEYPIFASATIERWVSHEADTYAAAKVDDSLELVRGSVSATLDELARDDVACADELPVARETFRRPAPPPS